jgi:hypothetical protein
MRDKSELELHHSKKGRENVRTLGSKIAVCVNEHV